MITLKKTLVYNTELNERRILIKSLLQLFVVIIVLIVYFPVLGHDFLYFWDDQWVVMNRYTEGGVNIYNLWAIFTEYYHGQYAPLNEMLYLILYSLFGYDPFFFHAASLLLHVSSALLVFACVERFLLVNTKIQTAYPLLIAFFTALLFAVHPFNVESVAWMSASKILVYAFYYLLATYSFLLYIHHKKIKYYIFTVLLFVCSFFGKEQAVTFPVLMLLVYWFTGYSFKDKRVWLTTAPLLILSVVFGVVTMLSQAEAGGGALSGEASYPLWQRLVYACYSFVEYLFKCIFPFKLSYLYPFPSVIGDALPSWLLVYPGLLTIALIAFGKYIWKNSVLLFSLVFFLIHLAVALHLIPLSRFAVVADRYAYISSIGVCFALSYGVVYLFKTCGKKLRITVSILFACYVLYFGVYSNLRSRVWYNTDTLKKELRDILQEREDYQDRNRWKDYNMQYQEKGKDIGNRENIENKEIENKEIKNTK